MKLFLLIGLILVASCGRKTTIEKCHSNLTRWDGYGYTCIKTVTKSTTTVGTNADDPEKLKDCAHLVTHGDNSYSECINLVNQEAIAQGDNYQVQ